MYTRHATLVRRKERRKEGLRTTFHLAVDYSTSRLLASNRKRVSRPSVRASLENPVDRLVDRRACERCLCFFFVPSLRPSVRPCVCVHDVCVSAVSLSLSLSFLRAQAQFPSFFARADSLFLSRSFSVLNITLRLHYRRGTKVRVATVLKYGRRA